MTRYAMMGLVIALAIPSWAVAAPPETAPLQNSIPAWSPHLIGALIGLCWLLTHEE